MDKLVCYICYDERCMWMHHTFTCGHGICHSCVQKLKDLSCPFCREDIDLIDKKCICCKFRYPQLVKLIYMITLVVNWLLVCYYFCNREYIKVIPMTFDQFVTVVVYCFFHPMVGLVDIYCFTGTWHDFYEIGIMHQVFLTFMLYFSYVR